MWCWFFYLDIKNDYISKSKKQYKGKPIGAKCKLYIESDDKKKFTKKLVEEIEGSLNSGGVDAAKEININVPLVVRLAGTNFKEGKEILDNSGVKLISAENLDDAAKKIIEAVK